MSTRKKLFYIYEAAKSYISNRFQKDQECWVLWIAVFFGIGIGVYFSLPFEPSLVSGITTFVLSFLLIVAFRKKYILSLLAIILFTIASGFLCVQVKAKITHAEVIKKEYKFITLKGKVEEVIPLTSGYRVILSDINIHKFTKHVPKKIRLTVRTNLNSAKAGDIISVKATISPPPIPVIPYGYDFARNAYFEQIGAVGFSLSEVKVIGEASKGKLLSYIDNLRNKMGVRIIEVLGKDSGNIAAALMIGQYNAIDKKILEDMRISGLSHILSVSGMHLTLVVMIFFITSRIILNLFEPISLEYNVKKIAAFIAIIGSFGYLLISGLQIAAIRSFIMSSMVILAIMLDRTPTPMRSVAWAALVILMFKPESIISPSFQMSFAAVIALIASYDLYVKIYTREQQDGLLKKLLIYFTGSIISSFIAGLATAPFAAFHFNQYSNYGVLANLLAAPITSFLIMPCVILAFFLYPLGLEKFALIPMGEGIEWLIKISEYIALIPHSTKVIPYIPAISLLLIIIGGLWICLWRSDWRWLGISCILAGISSVWLIPRADIIIDSKNGSVVLSNYNGKPVLIGRLSKFSREAIAKYYGEEELEKLSNIDAFSFKSISFDLTDDSKRFNCSNISVNIAPNKLIKNCANTIINKANLIDHGSYFVYLNVSKIKLLSVKEARGKRPWTDERKYDLFEKRSAIPIPPN
jgi:competence protein ComEC